jgi:hypothetical protein
MVTECRAGIPGAIDSAKVGLWERASPESLSQEHRTEAHCSKWESHQPYDDENGHLPLFYRDDQREKRNHDEHETGETSSTR